MGGVLQPPFFQEIFPAVAAGLITWIGWIYMTDSPKQGTMSPAAAPAAKEQPGTAQPAPKPRPRDRKKSRARIGELGRFQRALRFLIPLCVAAVWTEVAGLLLARGVAVPFFTLPVPYDRCNIWGLVQLVLFLPIVAAGREFYGFAKKDILQRIPSPEVLLTVSTAASLFMGLYTAVQLMRGIPYEVLPPLFFLYSGVCLTAALGANALDRWGKVSLPSFRDRPALGMLSGAILLSIVAFLSFFFTGRHGFPLWQIVASLLIVACPAGLFLATSLPAFAAAGKVAACRILLRDGAVRGDFYRTTMVVFDKTGTLTKGQVKLTDIFTFHNGPETGLLSLAAAMVQRGGSREAAAIREAAEGCALPPCSELEAAPEGGFETLCFHEHVRLGPKEYVSRTVLLPLEADTYADRLTGEGKTVWYLTVGRRLYAVFGFSDILRDEAVDVMQLLKKQHIRTAVMTGDNKRAAQYLGKMSGADRVAAELKPEHKADLVRAFQAGGDDIAAVGNDSYDAPALACADTGITIGSGDKEAWQASQIVLLDDDLRNIPRLLRLSRRCARCAWRDAWIASACNIVLVPAACGILTLFGGTMLTPGMLAVATLVSLLYLSVQYGRFRRAR